MDDASLVRIFQNAGFRGDALRKIFAIAKRESGGNPSAFNDNPSTGDLSYGLTQINLTGNLGPSRRKQYGLTSNEQLLDPLTNAKVAFRLSKGGTDFGAWGIGPNAYREGAGFDTIKKWYDQFPGSTSRGLPSQPPAGGITQPSVTRSRYFADLVKSGQWSVDAPLSRTLSLTREFNRTFANREIPGSGGFTYPKVRGNVGPGQSPMLMEAYRWLGTPYSWGGGGPSGPSQGKTGVGFDCSSFLQYLYARQGKQIPRVTYDQWRSGTAISRDQLQPGDAVFFRMEANGPGHVGVYAGDGKFIHAPKTGDVVKVSSLSDDYYARNYVGARRW